MISKFKSRVFLKIGVFALLSIILLNALKPIKPTLAYGVTFKTCKNVFYSESVPVPPTTEESTTEEPTSKPPTGEETTTEENGGAPVTNVDIPKTGGTILLVCLAWGSMLISAAVIVLSRKKADGTNGFDDLRNFIKNIFNKERKSGK